MRHANSRRCTLMSEALAIGQSSAFDGAAAALATVGCAVIPDVLPPSAIAELAADLRRRDDAGMLRGAGTGRGDAHTVEVLVRGDRIVWIEDDDRAPALAPLRTLLASLRRTLNQACWLGLVDAEMHYTLYPPGARYARHCDRFADDDSRVVSFVLYLNADWRPPDGGALRCHPAGGASYDVLPRAGTLVMFLSAELEHEVLPARRDRIAVTGWLRRRAIPAAPR
jgi:SM-20-related protein